METAAAVRAREVSAVEVTEAALRRAEDDRWGAFVTLAPELALAEAAELDRRLASPSRGFDRPLLGVPCPDQGSQPGRRGGVFGRLSGHAWDCRRGGRRNRFVVA